VWPFDKLRANGVGDSSLRIAVVAPACPIDRETAARVDAIAARAIPRARIAWHPQCFLEHGHFAGEDQAREDAFVEVANDPAVDAVWFARGGYGSCRIAERALGRLTGAAGAKVFLGYSDLGTILAGLYKHGIGAPVHGPMVADVGREGGEAAIVRALKWLTEREQAPPGAGPPTVAFNLTVLAALIGTPLQPDLAGHALLLEDVDEHHYRIDRALFQVTSAFPELAGIRQGRFAVPANNREFGADETAIFKHWCGSSGIAYLGTADIGHDADNKIVPFGVTS